jgi:hypothetical protein
MARKEPLVSKEELKTHFLEEYVQQEDARLYIDYDPLVDIWIIRFDWSNKETVVHYLDEYRGLIYYADSLEIIGIQVENVESGLLSNNPKMPFSIEVWKEIGKSFNGFKSLSAADMPVDHLVQAIQSATDTDLEEPILEFALALIS